MRGELLVQGSKNAALPILAATLLGRGIFILHHCPRISDVEHMLELLEDAELQTQMRECQKRYGKPDAAGDIYEYIVSRGRDKNSL